MCLDDTITRFNIRLAAIAAAELGPPFGLAGKKALSDTVFGNEVGVSSNNWDKYGRTAGYIMVDENFVKILPLEESMAGHYEHYDRNVGLSFAKEEARVGRKGLCSDRKSFRRESG